MEIEVSDYGDGPADLTAQPFTSVLQPATTYFHLVQSTTQTMATDEKSREPSSTPNDTIDLDIEPRNATKVGSWRDVETLALSGTIISAAAHIPYIVGMADDGKFEIAPRPADSALRDVLSRLSSLPTWNHILVGWTGKILAARSAEFLNCLSQGVSSPPSVGQPGQLSDVAIHDLGGSGINDAFLQHLKNKDSCEQEISVSKERRRGLETLLEHAFKDKIVPVWMGDWMDNKHDVLDLKDQDRWQAYVEKELFEGLNDAVIGRANSAAQAFADYQRMNESVADAIIKFYCPGDIIWVHDYHLMLLPQILRRKLPSAYIVYLHYTNWSDKDTLIKMPDHKTVAMGMIGASAVGMSSENVLHRAKDYYKNILKLEFANDSVLLNDSRHVQFLSVSLGIDLQAVQATAFRDSETETFLESISQRYSSKKKIVVRARSYRPGTILTLLNGFEELLSRHSAEAQNIVLFLVTAPGTQPKMTVSTDDVLDADTACRIVNINCRFGSVVYQPIIQIHRTLQTHEYFALLRSADLGIVASDHDAANSSSMEFVVCQQDKKSPLLILEQLRSYQASHNLGPWDTSASSPATQIANAISHGLNLDSCTRRVQEYERLLSWLTSSNVSNFSEEFITKACVSFTKFAPCKDVPELDLHTLSTGYASADKRLFMFDYDGTLTPIVNDPDAALPTEKLMTAIEKLASQGKNKVWIISGRSRLFLEKLFGDIKGLGLSAEHGSFIRQPGEAKWSNLAAEMDMGWKEETGKIFQKLVDRVDGSWIERKEVAMVWHYRNAIDHDACLAKAIESKAQLEGESLKNCNVEIMLGKANVEVRPRFLNKGATAAGLIDETFADETSGFVLCAGDDVTDEGKLITQSVRAVH